VLYFSTVFHLWIQSDGVSKLTGGLAAVFDIVYNDFEVLPLFCMTSLCFAGYSRDPISCKNFFGIT